VEAPPEADGGARWVGSVYVSVVLVALVGYFAYQSWFNPQRAVKRQLGEVAAILSLPAEATGATERHARADQLRGYLAPDTHIRLSASGPEFGNQDAFLTAWSAWTPPSGGVDVEFVDVQVAFDSPTVARAYMTVEITGLSSQTGELGRDRHEAVVRLELRDNVWIVTSAGPGDAARTP